MASAATRPVTRPKPAVSTAVGPRGCHAAVDALPPSTAIALVCLAILLLPWSLAASPVAGVHPLAARNRLASFTRGGRFAGCFDAVSRAVAPSCATAPEELSTTGIATGNAASRAEPTRVKASHFASRQKSPETQLRWAGLPHLKSRICLDTRVRIPILASPHRHLPWGMYTESKGIRSVKQAVSGIGTVGHYRTAQKQLECDGGYNCVCTPLIWPFDRPFS
jgi:hypothetical protein